MEKQLKSFVRENTWLPDSPFPHGWGNGYVVIPKGHKYHGIKYADIPVDVHGGLTFSEIGEDIFLQGIPENIKIKKDDWVVGFDTGHYGDFMDTWSKISVEAETQRLKEQLEKL